MDGKILGLGALLSTCLTIILYPFPLIFWPRLLEDS